MPRIRNWKSLTYYQHSSEARYQHIDALFADSSGGRHVIDWKLIAKMWPDLMRVAISIKEGASTPSRCCADSGRTRVRTRSTRRSGRSDGQYAPSRFSGILRTRRCAAG